MYQFNNPYQPYIPTFQSNQSLIRVTGLDGAKAYQMQPNSTAALFDSNSDLFYVKTTDGAGFPTIRTFKFEECTNQENTVSNYITREEMEQYVKQFISKQPKSDTSSRYSTNSNDKSSVQ